MSDAYATWDPAIATDEADGLPDRIMVPIVEALRAAGIVTYQSCCGHEPTAGYPYTSSGTLWLASTALSDEDLATLAASGHFEEVARLWGREADGGMIALSWSPHNFDSVSSWLLSLARAEQALERIRKRAAGGDDGERGRAGEEGRDG